MSSRFYFAPFRVREHNLLVKDISMSMQRMSLDCLDGQLFTQNTISGWFARDPVILKHVGKVLMQFQESSARPDKIFIPEDCFELLSSPAGLLGDVLAKSAAELYGSKFIFSPFYSHRTKLNSENSVL